MSHNPFWPRHAHLFKGGSAPVQQLPDPIAPTPPVSASSQAVTDVQTNLKKQQLRRRSISSTMYAGATGGWNPAASGAGNGLPQGPSVATGAGFQKTG